MDIRPPRNYRRPERPMSAPARVPVRPTASPTEVPRVADPVAEVDPVADISLEMHDEQPLPKKRRTVLVVVASIVSLLVLIGVAALAWYNWMLQPLSDITTRQEVVIDSGMTPKSISELLEKKELIRSARVFELYARFNNVHNSLQAGSYSLSPNQSVSDIVEELVAGGERTKNIVILPALTLKQLADPKVKNSFAGQGFSSDEIERALRAQYASPLLADLPKGASLEGYIFPETYQMRVGDTLESVIQRTLDELYTRLRDDDLITKFRERGLNLHQAITLASIIQKEVGDPSVQPQVAQVFLTRINIGMALGSDVTFMYAAEQAGVAPSVDLDSPYNTRKYPGLPPGPIANMNYSALRAVANPAPGDYLYFVAGDDGQTYFSRTLAEHNQLTNAHCIKLCTLE